MKDSVGYSLREKVSSIELPENKNKAIMKDVHLIEAAFLTDNRIISSDDSARDDFSEISSNIRKLKQIVWVNPINEEETPIEWIEYKAPPEVKRKLGYVKIGEASKKLNRVTRKKSKSEV